MFEDFLNLNYWKTNNKLRKIRELLNRIDAPSIERALPKINNSLYSANTIIEGLSYGVYRKNLEEEEEVETNLPDLTIKNIITTDYGHYVDFAITVQNIGKEVAGANILNVVIPDVSNVDLDVPSLEINETVVLYHQYSFDSNGTEKQKIIIASADSKNSVEESNERNNSKIGQATVKNILSPETGAWSQYIPPVGKAYIITHLHNPEGKEIGSISGVSGVTVSPGIIATNKATHGIPTVVVPGYHNIIATFNGITLNQEINIENGQTIEIFFIFPRTISEIDWGVNQSYNDTLSIPESGRGIVYYSSELNPLLLERDIFIRATSGASGSFVDSFDLTLSKYIFSLAVVQQWNVTGGVPPYPQFWRNEINFNEPFYIPPTTIGTYSFSTSNFNNWYSQSKRISGGYFKIKLGSIILVDYIPIGETYLNKFSANLSNTPIIIYDFSFEFEGGYGSPLSSRSGSKEWNNNGKMEFKMSSIPYDMEGTAV